VRPAPTIEIPDLFRERAPRFLAFAPGDLRLEPDVALNVVGFAPLGFLLALLLVRSGVGASGAILVAIALGAGLSLGIEWVQVHLPSRVSSATDLAANTLGTALGAALVLRFRGRGAQQQS
jgi:glycopeptide antibiotics resistance protein